MQSTTIPLYSLSQLKLCAVCVWTKRMCLWFFGFSVIPFYSYSILSFFFSLVIFFFFSIPFFLCMCFGFFWSVFLFFSFHFPFKHPHTYSSGDGGVYVMYTIRFISFHPIRNVHIPWPLVNGFYALLLLYMPATALFVSLCVFLAPIFKRSKQVSKQTLMMGYLLFYFFLFHMYRAYLAKASGLVILHSGLFDMHKHTTTLWKE